MNLARLAGRYRLAAGIGAVAAGLVIAGAVLLLLVWDEGDLSSSANEKAEWLSAFWRPSMDELYPASNDCAGCHPAQVEEWQASAHARSAVNPLVHASVCGGCHAPLGTQLDPEYQLKLFDRSPMPAIPVAAAEGVTCVTCHATAHEPDEPILTFLPTWPNWRVTDLALEIQPFDEAHGTFGSGTPEDPLPVANESHPSVVDPRLSSAALCRPCHEVLVDKAPLAPHDGLQQPRVRLLTTFTEWAESPYADTNETCQSCHMPMHERHGSAAVEPPGTTYDSPLPSRPLADHTLLGLSSEYLDPSPEVEQQEDRAAAFVRDTAALSLTVPPTVALGSSVDVAVVITNTGAGHDLPTGFAYWSEAWLEVVVEDRDGRVLFVSGDVDEQAWLRDEFNPRVADGTHAYDAYLVSLRALLVSVGPNRTRWMQPDDTLEIPADEVPRNYNGTPIIGPDGDVALRILRSLYPDSPSPASGYALQEGYVLRFADTVIRNGIKAGQTREAHFPLTVDAAARGPIRVTARLLIRSLWPWMLQQQEELPTPRPRPRTYEIVSAQASVAVEP